MPTFNPGDRVRRVRAGLLALRNPQSFGVIGEVYTVEQQLGVNTISLVGIREMCSAENFELVVDEAPQPKAFFWLFVFKNVGGEIQKRVRFIERNALEVKSTLEMLQNRGTISGLTMKKVSISLSRDGGYDADV